MALNRNAQSQAVAQPAFEDEENMNTATIEAPVAEAPVAEAPVTEAPAQAPAQAPAPQTQHKGALTAAAGRSVASPIAKAQAAFTEYENVFDVDQVANASGAVPKLTADLGGIDFGDKKVCTEIKVELLSYNKRYLITAGIEGEAGKELLRTSYDGVNLHGHSGTVEDYLLHLKEVEGLTKAAKRDYIDLWVLVIEEDGKVIPEEDRQFYQVQLSPQSVKKFQAFQLMQGIKTARLGGNTNGTFRMRTERNEYNGNKYANFLFFA